MNTGKETEQAAVDLYEQAGYETYRPPKAKYGEQDVFGLYDLLAFGHDRMVGVQVSGRIKAADIAKLGQGDIRRIAFGP